MPLFIGITTAPLSVPNYLFLFDLSIGEGSHFSRKNDWGELPRKTGIGPDEKYQKQLMEGFLSGGLFFPLIHIDQSKLCCIPNQFHSTVNIKLIHNIGSMVFNGFGADKEPIPDFLSGKPLNHQTQDLLFPACEGPVPRI